MALHENKQLDILLRNPTFPSDLMKKVVEKFGPGLHGLKGRFPGSDLTLNTRQHIMSFRGTEELKRKVIHELIRSTSSTPSQTPSCPIWPYAYVTSKMATIWKSVTTSFVGHVW